MRLEHPEHSEQKNILLPFQQLEVSLVSKKDLEKLESWLQPLIGEEAAGQCTFVLQSMADENYRSHCKNATQEFGRRLAERFGDEESFFELAPHAKFSDVKSFSSLDKIGFQKRNPKDYHSVGLLEFDMPKGQSFSLAFDLTYGAVAGKKDQDEISVLYSPGTGKPALEMLLNHYGGSWKRELEFNKKNGKFVFH